MRRLPPSSAGTLPSAFLSFLVHAAVVVGGLMVMPLEQPKDSVAQMIVVPIELVTVAEMTNLTAVSTVDEDKPLEEEAKAEDSNRAAGAPPPDEDTISFEPPKDKPKEEIKKPQAKPAPAPAEDFNDALQGILDSVPDKTKPKQQTNSAGVAPAASSKEAPRLSAGDKRRMTASIADIIRSQLVTKECFADHSDMADAQRLRVTFRLWFGRNGKFSQPYQLVSPSREPFNDPPMQAYIAHARRSLDKCNQLGWQVPEDYFRLPQPQYIDIEFLTSMGASKQ